MKKNAQRCKHCMLAVVRRSQKFSPHHRPPFRGTGRPKFNQLEMVTTYKPPLLNGRCTSLLRAPVSEMTYTVSSGTLNSTIPYHTIPYLQTQFGEDRCMQFRVIMVTDPQTNKQTHRQDQLQYTVPLSLACSVKIG